ncbi:uncharacterized protein LOC126378208 [Pectinophora gossypiella]|uniref:uncharacterized protein LOC126378208 n=1 Tax=Pectinophora gossypiella TaxID=13191 RepID=UPI00214E45EF|nr:uncharacterized protein LOC126378208 [Pectinophora gossypiella]
MSYPLKIILLIAVITTSFESTDARYLLKPDKFLDHSINHRFILKKLLPKYYDMYRIRANAQYCGDMNDVNIELTKSLDQRDGRRAGFEKRDIYDVVETSSNDTIPPGSGRVQDLHQSKSHFNDIVTPIDKPKGERREVNWDYIYRDDEK